jgi:hypothetical protein
MRCLRPSWLAHSPVGGRSAERRSTAGLEPDVLGVARSQGLDLREYRANDTGLGRTIVFNAPGCLQPLFVIFGRRLLKVRRPQSPPPDRTTSNSMSISIKVEEP